MSNVEQPCFRLQSFLDASPEQITEVVQTNLLGTMLCTRAAMQALAAQKKGGHIFNMDGAGANNLPSPMYAAYGATKAGAATLSPHPRAVVPPCPTVGRLGCCHDQCS